MTSDRNGEGLGAAQPKYAVIAGDILQQIEAGEIDIGDDLPTEQQLCEQYSASRFTVRQALKYLQDHGMIIRRQGSGSRVASRSLGASYRVRLGSEADVLRYAQDTSIAFRPLEDSLTSPRARLLGLPNPDEWNWYTGVRKSAESGIGIGVTDVGLRRQFAEAVTSARGRVRGALFARIAEQYGVRVERIEQSVSAVPVPASVAQMLDCEPDVPGLRIVRRYINEGAPFEVSITIHPGDRFEYSLTLDRSAF